MSNADRTRPAAALRRSGLLDRFPFVTDPVQADLERFVALLAKWQRTHNLVSRGSLDAVWERHIADSLQLLEHAPDFREWVDLGSGAGFPGLVVAIAAKDRPEAHFTLVESNQKKVAFLRAAIRDSGARADVAAERIEMHGQKMAGQADIVSARALAPLVDLCRLAEPYRHEGSVLLLLKGQDFVHEIETASKSWSFDVVTYPSATDSAGRVLALRNLRPKEGSP
jgi:16S rRNA (guanine527-N7)-methyltransferase